MKKINFMPWESWVILSSSEIETLIKNIKGCTSFTLYNKKLSFAQKYELWKTFNIGTAKKYFHPVPKIRPKNKIKSVSKKYSQKELDIVKDKNLSNAECAKLLNRTPEAIYCKRYALGIVTRRQKNYTPDELEMIYRKDLTDWACGKLLNISPSTVRFKRQQAATKKHAWDIISNKKFSDNQCSVMLNKTLAEIQEKRKHLKNLSKFTKLSF
jgi:hypothetical protein